MSWIISPGTEMYLYNARHQKWISKPRLRWSNDLQQNEWILQATTDIGDAQPIQIEFVPGSQPPVERNDLIRIYATVGSQKMYAHTPGLSSAGVGANPPLWVEWKPFESVDANHIAWKLEPVRTKSFYPATMGAPYAIVHSTNQEFVIVQENTNDVITDSDTATDLAEPWIFIPAFSLFRCTDDANHQCSETRGAQNILQRMTCASPDGPCHNEEDMPLYQTEEACLAKCFNPRYVCSGAPLYQCSLQHRPVPLTGSYADYDECILKCSKQTLTSARAAKKPTRAARAKASGSSQKSEIVGLVFFGLACAVSLVLSGFTLSRLLKNKG